MELTLLDLYQAAVTTIDVFESLIWTDRYNQIGDFEIVVPISSPLVDVFDDIYNPYYLILKESDHIMIVENLEISTDVEVGAKAIITGRSVEAFLNYRIVWNQTIMSGNLQTEIYNLLYNSIINPSITARKIARLPTFVTSTDPLVTTPTVKDQYFGEFVDEVVSSLCQIAKIGYKVVHNPSSPGFFQFMLYAGADRSYSQSVLPHVIFSPEFDNLLNSNYKKTKHYDRSVSLSAGEGDGSARLTEVAYQPGRSASAGLYRREIFVNASNISKTINGGTLSDADYKLQLSQKGADELAQNIVFESFEGQLETGGQFVYGTDFGMGDIVQVIDTYGHNTPSRVIEMIYSEDGSGIKKYPTFGVV